MISWSFYWFIFVLDEIFFVGVCMFSRFGFLEGVIDFFFFFGFGRFEIVSIIEM